MRSTPWFPCLLLLTTLFLGSLGSQAQTIDNVLVTGTPVCKPSSIEISFDVTNGTGKGKRFTASTLYTIRLVTINGTVYTEEIFETFRSTTSPNDSNFATLKINRTFQIPSTVTNRSNYQILISSTDPDAGLTIEATSAIFEVKSPPNAPTVGTITQPTCSTATGSVILGGLPATGTWILTKSPGETTSTGTGIRTTISGLTAGTYTYKVTNESGCISSASVNIIINTQPVTPSVPTASNNGPVCVGSTLNLSASTVSGATYNWTGPNGYTSSLQNPIINNVDSSNSGDYFVTATVNDCKSETGTTNVVIITSNTWTGATDTDWNDKTNWSCNSIPNLNLNVIIPDGLTNYPTLGNDGIAGECNNITIGTSSFLTVLDNTLNISGAITNSGTFDARKGTIAMLGSDSQTIPVNTFVSNRIRDLIIDNINGVSSSGNLEITGFLRVNQNLSTFDTGNMLTLISDATQTALIDGSGNGDVIGAVKMQRYLDTALGYKYISSPFNNSTVGDFNSYIDLSATFPQIYEYNENSTDGSGNDSTGWNTYTDAAALLGALEGYAFNFGPSVNTVTVELIGTVNNGDFARQISNTNGTYTKGFNLVGNPYPSPINWDAPEWTKTNIDDGIYFFSATDQYKGTYTSYVNKISSADASSSNIIPSMQGFFVHVSDGGDNTSVTNGVLALTNGVRVNDFNQQFIKRSEPAPVSLIRLSAGIKNNSTKDAMVIYFDPYAREGFEKNMDALKLINTDEQVPNLYSLTSESEKLSINALPESLKSSNQRIPLGIRSEIDGEMRIQLRNLENLPSNFNVYLIDEVKRIGQNLSEKPVYNFKINAGEYNSRFYLLFSEYELSDPALAFNEPFSIKTINGKVYVNLNLEDGTSGTLMATTVTGQILDRRDVTRNETISLDGIKSSGIYFIKLSWKDQNFSKKIIIQK